MTGRIDKGRSNIVYSFRMERKYRPRARVFMLFGLALSLWSASEIATDVLPENPKNPPPKVYNVTIDN